MATSGPIFDYEATAGVSRAALGAMHGSQPGDPAKAADALLAVLGWADPPLRLALGDDATGAIRSKLAAVADDLERTADISHYTAIST